MSRPKLTILTFTVEVAVDYEASEQLPGAAGTSYSPPIPGVDLEAHSILDTVARTAEARLHELSLDPQLIDCRVRVTLPRLRDVTEPF